MDFKEKSPPDAEKSQKEVHIVHFVESKGHTYPTEKTKELKICAECQAITNARSFRTHLEKFHKGFSQSLMDKLMKESPRTTCSKKTSISPADMISLVPWSVRNPGLFQQLNACSAEKREKREQKQWKPNRNIWTNNMEYIKLSDFIVKKAKNNQECVPQYLQQLAKEYKEHSGSTWAIKNIGERIRNFREAVHEIEEFDTDTKVKLIFLLSSSIDTGLLKKIRQTAHVELDEKNRITVYKSDTLNLNGDHSHSAKMRAVAADKKRRMSQIHVKNENEKPKSLKVELETDEKSEKLTEIVDLTFDSEDRDQSTASSTKSELLESKSSNPEALSEKLRSESKKEKFGGSSEHSDGKSLVSKHPEPQNSNRRAPSVKSELSRPKASNVEAPPSKSKLPGPKFSLTVAPLTSKPEKEKENKSKNSDGKSSASKHPVPISQFFPKISKAPTAETKLLKPKPSDTRAPPTSESEEKEEDDSEESDEEEEKAELSDESSNISENESISEIEEPPKRQVSVSKSESNQSESGKIQVSECPTASKSTDVSVESENEAENSEDVTENSGCDEEDVEDCGDKDEEEEKEESSEESSKNSEEESIAEIEEPSKRQISDSESVNEAENSEESELTENSDCDEEDVEECSLEDEEKEEEEEESEIHQTPPFRSQTANGNLSIPTNSHIRFLKSIMIFISNLELPELDYLEERIEERILEIKRFEVDPEKEVSINEIRTCLMTCFLIVTKSATASTKSSVRAKESVRSQESWMSLTNFLKLYKRFVTSLKWKYLENFEQNLKNTIEELGERDKRIPSSKVAFALQTIIEIVAP